MKQVAKYNLCKGISTLLTAGTPITAMLLSSDMFVHRPDTAISSVAVFAFILTAVLFKDKIIEKWKAPSALIISAGMLVILSVVESIIVPLKYICIATTIACGIDEVSFKRIYKRTEMLMGDKANAYKYLGFIFAKSETLEGAK